MNLVDETYVAYERRNRILHASIERVMAFGGESRWTANEVSRQASRSQVSICYSRSHLDIGLQQSSQGLASITTSTYVGAGKTGCASTCTATATMEGNKVCFALLILDFFPNGAEFLLCLANMLSCKQTAPPISFVRASRHVLLRCVKAADRYRELAKLLCSGMHKTEGQHFKSVHLQNGPVSFPHSFLRLVPHEPEQSRFPYEGRIGIGLPRAANALRQSGTVDRRL